MKAILILILFVNQLFAQSFGQNKVQYDTFDWEYVVSPNTNVYYYGDNYDLAIFTSKVAEKSLEQIGKHLRWSSNKPIKIIKINKNVEYSEGDRSISIKPSKLSLDIDFTLKYDNKIIGDQRNKINVYEDNLIEIFNSRTFCLFEDIEKLRSIGLAQGGSLENAVVVKDDTVLNEKGLRNDKEFVNHKILDCMGDIYLSGYKIIGKIVCSQGGHKLTNEILKKVYSNPVNFSIVEIKEKNLSNLLINQNYLKSIA